MRALYAPLLPWAQLGLKGAPGPQATKAAETHVMKHFLRPLWTVLKACTSQRPVELWAILEHKNSNKRPNTSGYRFQSQSLGFVRSVLVRLDSTLNFAMEPRSEKLPKKIFPKNTKQLPGGSRSEAAFSSR